MEGASPKKKKKKEGVWKEKYIRFAFPNSLLDGGKSLLNSINLETICEITPDQTYLVM